MTSTGKLELATKSLHEKTVQRIKKKRRREYDSEDKSESYADRGIDMLMCAEPDKFGEYKR